MFDWITGKIDCLLGTHDWSPDEFNDIMGNMDTGDEATLRCARCHKQIVTIERLPTGGLKWKAHVKEAVLYDLSDDYKKNVGMKHELDKFQEDNK